MTKKLSKIKIESLKRLHSLPRNDEWRLNLSKSQKRIGNKPPTRKIGTIMPKSFGDKISKSSIGKKMSIEARIKMSLCKKGKKHSLETRIKRKNSMLKKFSSKIKITPINSLIRSSLEYRLWRETIFKRDNWTCTFCLVRGGKLNADHIKPFAYYPELRFAIDNGRTLCNDCHKKTDTYGAKAFIYKKNL